MINRVKLRKYIENKGKIRKSIKHNQMEMCITISEIILFLAYLVSFTWKALLMRVDFVLFIIVSQLLRQCLDYRVTQ